WFYDRRRLDARRFRCRRRLRHRRGWSRRGRSNSSLRWRWRLGWGFLNGNRWLQGLDGLDQPRRSKHGRRRLWRLGLLRRSGLLCAALRRCRCLREHVAAWQRDATLPRNALDKRPRDDLFDGARRALQLDAVIAFEQRQHFLAGGAEQLRDFVDPDCCQCVPLVTNLYDCSTSVEASAGFASDVSAADSFCSSSCVVSVKRASICACASPASSAPNCASTSFRFSSSLLMSMRHPVSFAASRTFCPFLPMASDSCLSSTTTSITRSFSSTMDTRWTFAGLSALVTKTIGSSDHSTMSIFSPRSSRMIACTRVPFMPTQAPTGSTSRSREYTATFARSPASRTAPRIITVPS